MKHLILTFLLRKIEKYGTDWIVSELQKLHDLHPQAYQQFIPTLYSTFEIEIKDWVDKTGSKIGEEIVSKIANAIQQSALINGITLPKQ